MSEIKFKLGTRVKLKEGSKAWLQSRGSSGTVSSPESNRRGNDDRRCIVKWDIGSEYAYSIRDLVILSRDWDE